MLPGEAALRRARAFSEVMTDHVSLQRTGWGAKWPGTLAHARAKANTRHTRGERVYNLRSSLVCVLTCTLQAPSSFFFHLFSGGPGEISMGVGDSM